MTFRAFQEVDVPGPKRDFVGYGRHVPKVHWPNGARVAVSIVLNYEEGSEYSHPNGDARNDGLTEMLYGWSRSSGICARNRSSNMDHAPAFGD